MKELIMKVPDMNLPQKGMPYTWGSGMNWYVRLDSGTHWYTEKGLESVEPTLDHHTDAEDFRYATTIRFTDYTDAK